MLLKYPKSFCQSLSVAFKNIDVHFAPFLRICTLLFQCDPNLDVYAVWVETLDPNFPRIAFFANRNIEQGEELTFDYQMTSDVSSNSPSPRKREHIKCNCGTENCRTYLF